MFLRARTVLCEVGKCWYCMFHNGVAGGCQSHLGDNSLEVFANGRLGNWRGRELQLSAPFVGAVYFFLLAPPGLIK